MIVRDRPVGLKLFLILRGSVLQRIRNTLLINIVFAIIITLVHGSLFDLKITVTPIPFTLIGLPLAIFLGFRNNTAYARYWEGRKLWGEVLIGIRTLTRQCQSLITIATDASSDDVRVRMVRRSVAFAHTLRVQLRSLYQDNAAQTWLSAPEWRRLQILPLNQRCDALLLDMGRDLSQCVQQKGVDPCLAAVMDNNLTRLTAAAASCERILHTPMPFSYSLLLHRTAYLYCFLLPFGLVDSLGFMTPFVVAIVAYTFFGLDALGDEIEEPFGEDANDLPLSAMCRAIEISLRESLQDDNVPPPMQANDYLLH